MNSPILFNAKNTGKVSSLNPRQISERHHNLLPNCIRFKIYQVQSLRELFGSFGSGTTKCAFNAIKYGDVSTEPDKLCATSIARIDLKLVTKCAQIDLRNRPPKQTFLYAVWLPFKFLSKWSHALWKFLRFLRVLQWRIFINNQPIVSECQAL